MDMNGLLVKLQAADLLLTEAYKMTADHSDGKAQIGAVLVPLFEVIQSVKATIAEQEREERRRYQG